MRAVLQATDQLSQLSQSRELTGVHVTQGLKELEVNVQKIEDGEDDCTKSLRDELSDDGVWRQVKMRPLSEAAKAQLEADKKTVLERLQEPIEVDPAGIQRGAVLTDNAAVCGVAENEVEEWGNQLLLEVVEEHRELLERHLEKVDDDELVREWKVLKQRYQNEFCNTEYSKMWLALEEEPHSALFIVMLLLRTLTCLQLEAERVNDRLRRATHRGAANATTSTVEKKLFLQYNMPDAERFWREHALLLARRILANNPGMRNCVAKRTGRVSRKMSALGRVEQRMLAGTTEGLTFHGVPMAARLRDVVELSEASDGECDSEDPFLNDSTSGSEWNGPLTDDEEEALMACGSSAEKEEEAEEEEEKQDGPPHEWFKEKRAMECPRFNCKRRQRIWCARCGACKGCIGKKPCHSEDPYPEDKMEELVVSVTLVAAVAAAICQEERHNADRQAARKMLREFMGQDETLESFTRADLRPPLWILGYATHTMLKRQMIGVIHGLFRTTNDDTDFQGPKGDFGALVVTTRAKRAKRQGAKRPRDPPPVTHDAESERLKDLGLLDEEE